LASRIACSALSRKYDASAMVSPLGSGGSSTLSVTDNCRGRVDDNSNTTS
jgi:hypothetical protein